MSRTTALVFLLLAGTWKGQWPGASVILHWRLDNPGFNNPQAGTIEQQNTAIINGAATWNNCARFTFDFAGNTSGAIVANDGTNHVIVREQTSDKALATTWVSCQGGVCKDFDMVFWAGAPAVAAAGNGEFMSGGGIVHGPITAAGADDVLLTALDNWAQGHDYWRLSLGQEVCAGGGCAIVFSAPTTIAADGDLLGSSAVALADFNGDGRSEVVLTAIDHWMDGPDYWRFRIGSNCTSSALCTWSPIVVVESGAEALRGGGVAAAQFDANPLPDLMFVGIDTWNEGVDYWRYRIAMNCDAQGVCASLSPVQTVAGNGMYMSGGGVAVGDVDGDGFSEVAIFGIDNWDQGPDYWRYVIGRSCDGATGACTWSGLQTLDAGAAVMTGGGVTISDIDGDGNGEIVVAGIDNWDQGLDYWRYTVGTACNASTAACTWSPIRIANSGGAVLDGGGIAVFDTDADGTQDVMFSGIDQWGQGLDYWRTKTATSLQTSGLATMGNLFSPNGAAGTYDIRTIAAHEFGHAAGLGHTNSPNAIMTCDLSAGMVRHTPTCDDLQGLQQLYSTAGACGLSAVNAVDSQGATVSGGGIAIGNIDGTGSTQLIVSALDTWNRGNDYWRYSVGSGCNGGSCAWQPVQAVKAGGLILSSGGIALADFDQDGRNDIILTAIDNWDKGLDYWRFRVGTNCDAAGNCTWAGVQAVESGAAVLTGGGVAVTQLDTNPRPDVILAGIDSWNRGQDYWRYRIGMNCDGNGACTWSGIQPVAGGGLHMSGGGVAVGDIDGTGALRVVLTAIDNWDTGPDYWRYAIGSNCNGVTGACTWTPVQGANGTGNQPEMLCGSQTGKYVPNQSASMNGGGVTIADLNGNGVGDVVLSANEIFGALDYWRYTFSNGCNAATGVCNFQQTRIVPSGGEITEGGGVAIADIDADTQPDVVLTAIDAWPGKDLWRVRFVPPPCSP